MIMYKNRMVPDEQTKKAIMPIRPGLVHCAHAQIGRIIALQLVSLFWFIFLDKRSDTLEMLQFGSGKNVIDIHLRMVRCT